MKAPASGFPLPLSLEMPEPRLAVSGPMAVAASGLVTNFPSFDMAGSPPAVPGPATPDLARQRSRAAKRHDL